MSSIYKNILVTGGCGFIGSNLVKMLSDLGFNVSIVDNLSSGSLEFLDQTSRYTFHHIDILDSRSIERIFIEGNYSAVIHLAASGSVVESVNMPEKNFDINVVGTFNILNAVRKARIPKLIFSSTGGALIGNASPPVDEMSVPRPISPYGASKLACEGYCCAFANAYGISVTALRFANVIGPISWHKKGAVTAFYKAIMSGEPIRIYGDGSATRDFLYVNDLCRGIILSLKKESLGFNVYHLASGKETSIKELAVTACDVAAAPSHVISFEEQRVGEVERNFANYELARKELGFIPEFDFEEGMLKTWEWFRGYSRDLIN